MPVDTTLRRELLTRIVGIAQQRLSAQEATQFRLFLDQALPIHPEESLFEQPDRDGFAVFHGLYRFVQQREPGESKIQVFNPVEDEHGWFSEHTLIYLCQQDVPFLVDSLRMALNRARIDIHLFQSNQVHLVRDEHGSITDLQPGADAPATIEDFAVVFIDRQMEADDREAIERELRRVLGHVNEVVADFHPMVAKLTSEIERLKQSTEGLVTAEEIAFLEWLRDGNFTFLGISEFDLEKQSGGLMSVERSEDRLGLMKLREALEPSLLEDLSPGFAQFHADTACLAFTKSTQRSTVHRDVYADYVIIKRRDEQGNSVGEMRLLGLYTSRLYHLSISQIPLVRKKSNWVLEHSQLDGSSHNGKTLISIMEGHPRDELIQATEAQLLETLLGIWKIYERKTVRLFLRTDPYEKFASCIVYLPRESLRTRLRERIERHLGAALNAQASEFSTQFLAESVLARIHIVFHITDGRYRELDLTRLEREIAEIVRDWESHLAELVRERWGENEGRELLKLFGSAFPTSYQAQTTPDSALGDLDSFYQLQDDSELAISFFKEPDAPPDIMRLKLFRRDASLELSDLIPMLENLGFRVLVEHPHRIEASDGRVIWMLDFRLRFALSETSPLDIGAVRHYFEAAFLAIWRGESESDGFNRLVLGARLDWRSVFLLRAYARYMKQLGVQAGQEFISEVLSRNPDIARNLIALFRSHFDPRLQSGQASSAQPEEKRSDRAERLQDKILEALDLVDNLNEDQVIRTYLELINATQRTNYFQQDDKGNAKTYLSIKIATRQVEVAPEPRPAYEVFVYSPAMEGVHLRNGKVARGGIRWSDRLEDYRTEILGLVKAQHVKNAVIVPLGAKGGFTLKKAPGNRDAWLEEGRNCYRTLIRGMLDITDQVEAGATKHPPQVICRDDYDPYLVVAADKGTASFSDIANEISSEYGYWLGDAFASGGSQGYDHKKMGITARGAWVAVQRHFRELGLNVDQDEFSVLGIGDMSGDVFGNAMLLSKKIRLVAAFNHQHIFIDPDPDPESSWQERKRLFGLERSTWDDYNKKLISTGGGIFSRSTKSIPLSPEMRAMLDVDEEALNPNQLIKALMQARVDLIWNGGIGTYVKSSSESNADAGDRSNDALRVNGNQLRCRVFGEGGNLGMTQAGRIQYCQGGGICNTDFIDNSAGVDCSDHEVNIKILLNEVMAEGKLDMQKRNNLLAEMEEDVAELVLRNNYDQTLAISLAQHGRDKHHHEYARFMEYLEAEGHMKRSLEGLPDEETLKERTTKGIHWTRPELSVLVSYAKVVLKQQLADSHIGEEAWTRSYLDSAFPSRLVKDYDKWFEVHRLRNEIVATQLANHMVDRMGFSYCYRMQESSGASVVEVARAFALSMKLFRVEELWARIESQDYTISAEVQYRLLRQVMRLGMRSTRWYLRNRRNQDPGQVETQMTQGFSRVAEVLPEALPEGRKEIIDGIAGGYREAGVPAELAEEVAILDVQFLVPGIVDLSLELDRDVGEVTRLRFMLSSSLSTYWLMQLLVDWQPQNRWQDFAREAHVDDLESLMRRLTHCLLKNGGDRSLEEIVHNWEEQQSYLIKRFQKLVQTLDAKMFDDLSVFTVALRQLKGLVDATFSSVD